jgi:hypothetical protein
MLFVFGGNSMKLLLIVVSIFSMEAVFVEATFAEEAQKPKAVTTMAQSRDLYLAPPQGRVSTCNSTAFVTFEGQVAQGLFNKMPLDSIIKDPSATCSPTGIVKMAGDMLCTHYPAKKSVPAVYECEMSVDLQTGKLLPPSDECGEDGEFIQEEQEKAAKNQYWINWNGGEK